MGEAEQSNLKPQQFQTPDNNNPINLSRNFSPQKSLTPAIPAPKKSQTPEIQCPRCPTPQKSQIPGIPDHEIPNPSNPTPQESLSPDIPRPRNPKTQQSQTPKLPRNTKDQKIRSQKSQTLKTPAGTWTHLASWLHGPPPCKVGTRLFSTNYTAKTAPGAPSSVITCTPRLLTCLEGAMGCETTLCGPVLQGGKCSHIGHHREH